MACGEKMGRSIRRASLWEGGSDEIGGARPAGASSPGGRNSLTTTLREVKRPVSEAMDATPPKRVGNQAPPYRLVWATGHCWRRSSQIGYGLAAQTSSV